MADTGVQARRSAVYLLDQVLGDEPRLMSELLASGALDKLPPDDRARAQRLAQDTLRGLERADRLLQKHLQKAPPLTVRNVLRVGTVELCQGGAAHGVVNTMVNLVSQHRTLSHLKGLTNAVLRKIAAQGPEAWDALRAPRLPKWLRGPPGFAEGDWWVQDAAAAIPVRVLAPTEGEAVLDLCAAPGGKTMQLAAAGAVVTAVDQSHPRMQRVKENLARVGLKAKTLTKDARAVEGAFDAILLDAPCSATGTIRRHPDLPHAKDGSEFGDLIELQSELIDHAWTLLKPGGRLVFCTCSLLPDEGEVQVDEALERHGDMTVDRAALDLPGVEAEWVTEEGGLRLRPDFWADKGGMDGFYIACLRKG